MSKLIFLLFHFKNFDQAEWMNNLIGQYLKSEMNMIINIVWNLHSVGPAIRMWLTSEHILYKLVDTCVMSDRVPFNDIMK